MTSQAMSGFWSLWISVITLGVIAFCWWLLYANRKTDKVPAANGEVETTGHAADGIEEYDNPLPRWWFIMFVITIVFGLVYLALYPGLGNYKGLLGWTSTGQWQDEMARAEERYAPIFQQYAQIDIRTLASDPAAMQVADRLYQNNCAVCHGSSARGAYGFPNLTDGNWLYGGDPEVIRDSIIFGRNGLMPAWVDMLGERGVDTMTHYVLGLSGLEHDAAKAEEAAPMYQAICSACHGVDGQGSAAMGLDSIGAPNLTANSWMYVQPGQSVYDSVAFTLRHGRNGLMPAQARYLDYGVELPNNLRSLSAQEKAELLPKVHLVTAYIYSLNQGK
ncbi:cytochrome-c oxidase, cbb3-type subunit III [Marinospirillum alkaliphilum]|uniref:Cbb3-type cytochrome c oxidase subunit n=1 Tax=Marinospirillum alkaliphilum DSM 21637 TaxID=1122209 RepID=A0A1K1VH27_9GAMM|nr:cytochrome-c oxidase, cbb3-type subunit III [Marinospirillum alkaliphilum]SFX24004.1 cytochrome c oxidase cbb3-type subunit 3 [Marinospirillum alkaliphilum DSM 21637]